MLALELALAARAGSFDDRHETAFRLLNGFTEGCQELAVDLYARTLVIHNYADPPQAGARLVEAALEFLISRLPLVQAAILKTRNDPTEAGRRGRVIHGTQIDRKVRELGVWYALDLALNRDASLYLDTRNLRKWASEHLKDKTVLNTFAYTGSLGVAATAGGASRVVHTDLNRRFLNLAKTSYALNGFPIDKKDFVAGDFFSLASRMKRSGASFDCVFLDPPCFSVTSRGTVDLAAEGKRLINKVRPLVGNGGWLVAINNALYVSGKEYMATLEELCADGYLQVEELIPVPEDFTGYPETVAGKPITDPAPFNHSTKIAVLRVRRKE